MLAAFLAVAGYGGSRLGLLVAATWAGHQDRILFLRRHLKERRFNGPEACPTRESSEPQEDERRESEKSYWDSLPFFQRTSHLLPPTIWKREYHRIIPPWS